MLLLLFGKCGELKSLLKFRDFMKNNRNSKLFTDYLKWFTLKEGTRKVLVN